MSVNEFTTDSLVLLSDIIKSTAAYQNDKKSKMQAYIGVYTSSPTAVYSLLMNKISSFNPIKLMMGNVQSGSVR